MGRACRVPERGPSSRPLSLAVEESVPTFERPARWSKRAHRSEECVNKMARHRVRVSSGRHWCWVRTVHARTCCSSVGSQIGCRWLHRKSQIAANLPSVYRAQRRSESGLHASMRVLTHSGVAKRRRDRVWWRTYRRGLEQASTEALVPGMGSQVQSGMSETGVTHGSSLV